MQPPPDLPCIRECMNACVCVEKSVAPVIAAVPVGKPSVVENKDRGERERKKSGGNLNLEDDKPDGQQAVAPVFITNPVSKHYSVCKPSDKCIDQTFPC